MFDDLDDNSGFSPAAASEQPEKKPAYQPSNNQGQNRSYGGGGNGYGNGGGGSFQRKEDSVQDPYLPIVIFVEQDFPEEAKTSLYNIASKLIAKGFTIRVYGTDKAFVDRVAALSSKFVEVYLPWRNFNEIDSKHTFNGLTCKDIAQKNFIAWEKIPDAVKGILSGQVRLIFGDRNNSVAMYIITWTKDGASRGPEVTKDTGRCGFLIKMASSYGFPVLNISKQSSGQFLERTFGI